MATPEPRAAQQLRATDITGQKFALTRRGLDPDEVYGFLQTVADQLSGLQGEIDWLRARGEHLERRVSPAQEEAYTRLSGVFEGVVRRADEAAARVRIGTEEEARVRGRAAREEADRIVLAAREEADRILRVAREEADWLREQAVANVRTGRATKPEDFDLRLDATLSDLFDEAD